jgi:formamidopyrimidine-DNA glycosylase
MPELPEVEVIVRGLDDLLVGKIIDSADSNNPKSFPNDPVEVAHFLIGSKVLSVKRRGKTIIINLSSQHSLVIHLKMTGQLIFRDKIKSFGGGHPNKSLVNRLPDKSTHVILKFHDGGSLYFNDQRKFGWMRLLPTIEIKNLDFYKKIGPEPLDSKFTGKVLFERLQRRAKSSIKPVLLDQTVLAGIGNIYADESLWMSKIHPKTRVAELSRNTVNELCRNMKEILSLSIEKGGSTDKNYVNAYGQKGSYLNFANVFRKEGQPCSRCGTIIIKFKLNGRGTHICPKEQRIQE